MSRQFPKFRSDLRIDRRADGNFLVTDPVSGKYFLFSEIELSLAKWLHKADSLQQWCEGWNQENRTQQFTLVTAESFLVRLMNDQLISVPSHAEGARLHQLEQRTSGDRWLSRLKNPLAIRLPGVDPGPFLKHVSPLVGWLFRPAMMVVSLLILTCLAMLVVLVGVKQTPHLPTLAWLLSPAGIAGMLLVFVGVKIVHELGHAIAAMEFGADCKQIGVMFLFFMPTLYCDVTTAWRLESRTQRIAISAAGVYVELMIALLAAISWALSSPGIVNTVSFQLMALCGISTLFINGNPLMRYDGYYVLSDLLNRPNLSLRSRHELHRFMATMFSKSWFSFDWTLVVYGGMAAVYRWVVLAAIVVAIICFTNEKSIEAVGWLLAAGLLLWVGHGFMKSNRSNRRRVATRLPDRPSFPFSRFAMAMVVAGSVWFVCCVPLPRWVYVDVQVQPVKAQTLFATSNGFVNTAKMESGHVQAGQVVLNLDDPELSHQYAAVEIEAKRAINRIEQLQRQARQLPELNETLAAVAEQVKSKQVRLDQLRSQLQSLDLVSSVQGRVESLLVQRNPGNDRTVQQVRVGQPIARIIDDSQKEVRLLVDEHTIDLLEPDQVVCCCFDHLPNQIQNGSLGQVLIGGWEDSRETAAVNARDRQDASLVARRYLVSVKTASLPNELGVFSGGRARVKISPATLLSRLNQQLQHTFQYR